MINYLYLKVKMSEKSGKFYVSKKHIYKKCPVNIY